MCSAWHELDDDLSNGHFSSNDNTSDCAIAESHMRSRRGHSVERRNPSTSGHQPLHHSIKKSSSARPAAVFIKQFKSVLGRLSSCHGTSSDLARVCVINTLGKTRHERESVTCELKSRCRQYSVGGLVFFSQDPRQRDRVSSRDGRATAKEQRGGGREDFVRWPDIVIGGNTIRGVFCVDKLFRLGTSPRRHPSLTSYCFSSSLLSNENEGRKEAFFSFRNTWLRNSVVWLGALLFPWPAYCIA